MTILRHYLELQFAGRTFLLPNTSDLLIEPRENMHIERKGQAAALRVVQGVASPAYILDADLRPIMESQWTRAVFLGVNSGRLVGLLIDDLRLLPADTLRIEPFTPLGPVPKTGYHLFDAAAMATSTLTLVFSSVGLAAYLQAQGDRDGVSE
ncbi:MAG TPA: hypothetical protein VMV40_08260 [Acidiferrobacter sp.]|nr:hypothetical protein [Acidiferrobacter sp.]